MTSPGNQSFKKLVANRRALRDYHVLERVEAGLELKGTEVKSIRGGQVNLTGAFARVEEGQAFLYGMNVTPYEFGNRFNHEADRTRRLLLHRREIQRLLVQTGQKGHTLVPLSIYLKRGKVKVEIGICKGKLQQDKRAALRERTDRRESERAMARRE